MGNHIFIVTGASGKLGKEFVQTLENCEEKVISLSRREYIGNTQSHVLDLLDENLVETTLHTINFSQVSEITLIHTVGKFKFEEEIIDSDSDEKGIDDEVYSTNVITLKNLLKPLLEIANGKLKVTVCVFASVSDKHNVPFWSSYTRAKNILRGYLHALCEANQIQALVVNVSTVDTGNENLLRPYADKTYWLQPKEIVSATLPALKNLTAYSEIDVIKNKPGFDGTYYLDHDAILEKWHREMGRKR